MLRPMTLRPTARHQPWRLESLSNNAPIALKVSSSSQGTVRIGELSGSTMLTLQENSLDWALRHALKYGDTDVFPLPFEYEAVNFDWDNVRRYLAAQNVLNWATRPCRSLLSPKAKYAFRTVTQLDPLDFLLFAATVKEIADDLEGRRIPRTENRVFSYRIQLNTDGQLFDPRIFTDIF